MTLKISKTQNNTKNKMQSLLEKSKEHFYIPKPGDVLSGKIIQIKPSIVLIDLDGVGIGAIYAGDFKNLPDKSKKIKKGKEISGIVHEVENEDGYVELSLDLASSKEVWKELKNKMENNKIINAQIIDANKGGLIAEIKNILAFLPVSQLTYENYPRVPDGDKNKILEKLNKLIGKSLKVKIIDVNQRENKLIVSEKIAMQKQEKELLGSLEVGQIIKGTITGVAHFGAFIKFYPKDSKKFIEGLIHISELAWQRIEDTKDVVKVGDEVEAKIIDIDKEKVSLSIKDLKQDPWIGAEKKYKIGSKVKGEVIKIDKFGAFVQLDKNIHGLAHISQFNNNIDKKLESGKKYEFKVVSMESKAHRLGLELVQNSK